jgi:phage N-6-adenine-methyltransferase
MTITEGMFSSQTDEWATPQDFFDKWNKEFDFTLDPCATPENAKCARYFTKEQDGLAQSWTGRVWMNPPYGREISKWVRKAYEALVVFWPRRWTHEDIQRMIWHRRNMVAATKGEVSP